MKGHLLFSALQEILFFPGPGMKGGSKMIVISVVFSEVFRILNYIAIGY